MQAVDFVQSYIDAWNHCDAKGVAEHLAKNGTYFDIPQNEQHSRDDLVGYLVNFFASEHHSYQLIGEVLSSDKSIAFQYKMTPESRAEEDVFGAEFMNLKGDGVIKIADYYDPTHSVRPAIGRVANSTESKYAKSGLNPDQMGKYTQQLTGLMDGEKVYLDSDLTMPQLASLVGCSVNHLSQAINAGFDMSFFDFLNSYRIEEAKSLLGNDSPNMQAVLDISFSVGFNSNSSFYAAFKKATDQTPAQYRRAVLKKGLRS